MAGPPLRSARAEALLRRIQPPGCDSRWNVDCLVAVPEPVSSGGPAGSASAGVGEASHPEGGGAAADVEREVMRRLDEALPDSWFIPFDTHNPGAITAEAVAECREVAQRALTEVE